MAIDWNSITSERKSKFFKGLRKDINYLNFERAVSDMNHVIYNLGLHGGGVIQDPLIFDFDYISSVKDLNFYETIYNIYKVAIYYLKELHDKYKSAFPDEMDFVKFMFESIKYKVSDRNFIVANNKSVGYDLNQEEIKYYTKLRKRILDRVFFYGSITMNPYYDILYKELSEKKLKKCVDFCKKIEHEVEKRLSKKGFKNLNSSLDEVEMKLVDEIFDSVIEDLPELEFLNSDSVVTRRIKQNTKNFLDSKNPTKTELLNSSAEVCSFLINYLLSNDTGLLAQNIAFDGYRFFNIGTGETVRLDESQISTIIGSSEREDQSNFVLNEVFAKMLIYGDKQLVSLNGDRYVEKEEFDASGNLILRTRKSIYRLKMDEVSDEKMKLGYFEKVLNCNLQDGTFDIALYYYCDDKAAKGIQLMRCDKISKTYMGRPSSHRQMGGGKIYSTCHIHMYNLLNAILKNYSKPETLGQMDIFDKIIIKNETLQDVEFLFNQKCGISGYDRSSVLKEKS